MIIKNPANPNGWPIPRKKIKLVLPPLEVHEDRYIWCDLCEKVVPEWTIKHERKYNMCHRHGSHRIVATYFSEAIGMEHNDLITISSIKIVLQEIKKQELKCHVAARKAQ